jgi:hypothetical protein
MWTDYEYGDQLGTFFFNFSRRTSQKVAGSIPDIIVFINWHNRTMVLGSTQPLTEMSTRNLRRGKGQSARKADNLTAICELII